ncbi:MAG: hypothetical protein K8S87_07180, partial [Planctomycetes bacterium]|nr:hypothetical protein [Planctomycetota bacterium]
FVYLNTKHAEKKSYRALISLRELSKKYPGLIQDILEGYSISDLGREYNLSRQRVHQIKVKLKEVLKAQGEKFLFDFFIENEIYKDTDHIPTLNYWFTH